MSTCQLLCLIQHDRCCSPPPVFADTFNTVSSPVCAALKPSTSRTWARIAGMTGGLSHFCSCRTMQTGLPCTSNSPKRQNQHVEHTRRLLCMFACVSHEAGQHSILKIQRNAAPGRACSMHWWCCLLGWLIRSSIKDVFAHVMCGIIRSCCYAF